jgi:hypothetical protein
LVAVHTSPLALMRTEPAIAQTKRIHEMRNRMKEKHCNRSVQAGGAWAWHEWVQEQRETGQELAAHFRCTCLFVFLVLIFSRLGRGECCGGASMTLM